MESEQRLRKSARQRERRARQREQHEHQKEDAAISAPTLTQPQCQKEKNDRDEKRARRAEQQRARRRCARAKVTDAVVELSERVLSAQSLTQEEVDIMGKSQNFTRDPRLALAYYHCCGVDPSSFVFGDERLNGDEGRAARARLTDLLKDCPDEADIAACQQAVSVNSSEASDIWACASCGRILLENNETEVVFRSLEDLQEVLLDQVEREALFRGTTQEYVEKYRQVLFDGNDIYFLIPDLVKDRERIPLCAKCSNGPRSSSFSVAAGHDYGRIHELPPLSDVAMACITPVRCFGIELSLSGKHSHGHAICFPSSGPYQISRTLPSVDKDCMPRVTFIGPNEDWRVQREKYKRLYDIPVDDVYEWLRVLAAVNDVFIDENIVVDDSNERRELLGSLQDSIMASVHVTDSEFVATMEDESSERYDHDLDVPGCDSAEVVVRSSAVLPMVTENDSDGIHRIIDAMADTIGGEPLQQDTGMESPALPSVTETTHGVSLKHDVPSHVVVVKRGRSPYVEWIDNAKILAGVFPNLFLTGAKCLPSGSLPQALSDHFMHYWDGRFEKSVSFTALLFNQLQRHSAVRKTARVGDARGKTLERFGKLAATAKFKVALLHAKKFPESGEAKKLNGALLRLLALVGVSVPFSPFERAATRPKLGAMRYKYGVGQHWVTIAPPEQDDLILHRIAQLRAEKMWNEHTKYTRKECKFADFPESIRLDARERLRISNTYPALSAQMFERQIRSLTRDIIRCYAAEDTRTSRSFFDQSRGVYGRVAAFTGVIEPQVDGRLHAHLVLYGSAIQPSLLTRLAACAELQPLTRQWLDSVCCTSISSQTREWLAKWRTEHGPKLPRAFDIDVPDASVSFKDFLDAAEKRALTTNIHKHSSTCRKGIRGKYVCRLSRPAGVHEDITKPLHIRLKQPSVLGKRRRAIFDVQAVSGELADHIDRHHSYPNKRVLREHCNGAIVWEKIRPSEDSMFVETNLALACLSGSHTNSAIINGKDAGDMVDEYQQSYMTKEKGGLKCGAAVMLTAVEDMAKYPSVADDSDTPLRQGKYLASRTVNAFTGAHEWSHSLMVYALARHRSFFSSDTFWYVFPHQLVLFVDKAVGERCSEPDICENRVCESELNQPRAETNEVEENTLCVQDELDELISRSQDEDSGCSTKGVTSGAKMYKLEGKLVFVSQAESYRHRGNWFEAYTELEFEMIVDILPRPPSRTSESQRGRPKRPGFDLGPNHPLSPLFQGFIRAKFKTAMLGGAPPPTVLKDGQVSLPLAKYLLCLLTPWCLSTGKPEAELSADGFLQLCRQWNRSTASFINRQRYRYLENFLEKHYRSSRNEKVCSEWRSRDSEFWQDGVEDVDISSSKLQHDRGEHDYEASGVLSVGAEELYELTTAAAAKDRLAINAIQALRATFWSIIPNEVDGAVNERVGSSIFFSDGVNLSQVARRIQTMTLPEALGGVDPDYIDGERLQRGQDRDQSDDKEREQCSTDQQIVYDRIVESIEGFGRLRQSLTVLHGGGGTGKSTLIRRITKTLKTFGIDTVNTCPTGVGASHLDGGRTFHSAFKAMQEKDLSPNDLELLRLTFTDRVGLIVLDEMSMFLSEFLVLLSSRLRLIYRSNVQFGGKSVMLAGDFLQLDATGGVGLCKMLYIASKSTVLLEARALFQKFTVYFLHHQHRAADCLVQQANLAACRALPDKYPSGLRWTEAEKSNFRPFSGNVLDCITTQLTMRDISNDPGWLDQMRILVTNNIDRSVLTGCTTRMLAQRSHEVLFRWKRKLTRDLPMPIQSLVYDEDTNPEVFAYFISGAPAQILDNNNGNVLCGIANGTPCKLHSLAWNDEMHATQAIRLIEEARASKRKIVDLPVPPDYVNVRLADFRGDVLPTERWPNGNNLETSWELSATGERIRKASIVIPIGIMGSKNRERTIRLGKGMLAEPFKLKFHQHAVDVAQVMTVWKAQGATIERVVINLEPARPPPFSPKWGFEHIFVAISRVTAAQNLRCLPLSGGFRRTSLSNLVPNIFTTKWRMDNHDR